MPKRARAAMERGSSATKKPTSVLGVRHCRGIAEKPENGPMVEVGG